VRLAAALDDERFASNWDLRERIVRAIQARVWQQALSLRHLKKCLPDSVTCDDYLRRS
jgi:hypothetical protein